MDAGPRKLTRSALGVIALLVLLYGGAHLAWYWATPLGGSAVLDERENLQLAAQIAGDRLPAEPFYRAMGYPLLLAGLHAAGLVSETAPYGATALGLLLHVLNTLLVARLAQRWFGCARAGLAAGLLHGLNPVLIHYATQILDGTLANAFFLFGLQFLPAQGEPRRPRHAIWLSLAWTGAALVRPQFLVVWFTVPLVWLAAGGARGNWRAQLRPLLLGLAAGGGLWLGQGAWSWHTGGEFRLLPWQGPYNLWAANKPGTNGRYYTQTMLLPAPAGGGQENPARLESIQLYRLATGDTGPLRIDVFNRYWQDRLVTETLAHPTAWLRLVWRKAYYLANNTEQYNNKTYAFHKALSPWLRFNPLGWGVLLLSGALGLMVLARTQPPLFAAVVCTAGALAAGILLVYVSARFRLPLAALLCALAGGAVAAPRLWWPSSFRAQGKTGLVLLLLGVLAYSNWFGAADQSTYVQDHLLLATAAERTGDDRITWDEAHAALGLRPGHPDALALGLSSYFNLLLTDAPARPPEAEWLRLARTLHQQSSAPETVRLANIVALALWRSGDPAGAQIWRKRSAADPEALAALVLSNSAGVSALRPYPAPAGPDRPGIFLRLARARWTPAPAQTPPPVDLQAAADRLFPAAR